MGLLAAVASFFVAGLGQAINGEVGKGIKIFLLVVVLGGASTALVFSALPVLLAVITNGLAAIVWFLQLLDAAELFEFPLF